VRSTLLRDVSSFLRYALWPGRTVAAQVFGGTGLFALIGGSVTFIFGSRWAAIVVFLLVLTVGLLFATGFRLFRQLGQKPSLVFGQPYVRAYKRPLGEPLIGGSGQIVAQHTRREWFVNINVRNPVLGTGTGLPVEGAYAIVTLLSPDEDEVIRRYRARWAGTEDRTVRLAPDDYEHALDLLHKVEVESFPRIYNNDVDDSSFTFAANSFLVDIAIKGENFVSDPSPRFMVISHADGPLEVKPVAA
jgi:hypothetical protein